jgi:hypothetical protein
MTDYSDFINFLKTFGRVIKIKLPRGLVSKIILLSIIAIFLLFGICYFMKIPWLAVIIAIFILFICIFIPVNLIKFAKDNPVSALLEGSEFIVHEKLQLASKEKGIINVTSDTKVFEKPVNLSVEELQLVSQNDRIELNDIGEEK